MDRAEGRLEVFAGDVRAVGCGLGSLLGCVLAGDGGATTADVGG